MLLYKCVKEGDDVNTEMLRTAWTPARDTSTTEAQLLSRGVYLTSLVSTYRNLETPQFLSILLQQVADNLIAM